MNSKQEIIGRLKGKNVLIWGARMTGLGAYRALLNRDVSVVGFIDSDEAFKNRFIHGRPVISPSDIKSFSANVTNLTILIAVSLKENEIKDMIAKLEVSNVDVISFQAEDTPYYTIDILSSCNLRCSSCPHSIIEHGVPRGSMTLETFKKVFDKILGDSPDISHISLYSWGEPLLHPYIDQIVKYVHDKNVAVALSSNLSIDFNDRLEKLIKISPDYLKVSVSGYYPETYSNTHEGGDVNLVKSNLYKIKYYQDYYKSNTLVDINYHLYRDNCGSNLDKFSQLADELGFVLSKTYALVMPLERVIDYCEGTPDKQTLDLEKNLLVTISEGIEASSESPLPAGICPFRENQININADLSVPVCCTVYQRGSNVVAKNFLETTLQDINLEKNKVPLCAKCMKLKLPEYNMGFNKLGWDNYAEKKELLDRGNN